MGIDQRLVEEYASRLQLSITHIYCKPSTPEWRADDVVPAANRFYYVLDGEAFIQVGGKQYRPKPGQLLLLPVGVRHSYRNTGDRRLNRYFVHFAARVGDVDLFQLLKCDYSLEVPPEEQHYVTGLFDRLLASREAGHLTSAFLSRTALLEIVSYFLEKQAAAGKLAAAASVELERISAVLSYMERHLGESITLKELAEVVHVHPNYFAQYFKSVMGMPPLKYMNRMRLEKAKQLLMDNDLSVGEVAERVGIQLGHFSKTFKAYTGLSPTAYRHL